jgi:hypothetical protein
MINGDKLNGFDGETGTLLDDSGGVGAQRMQRRRQIHRPQSRSTGASSPAAAQAVSHTCAELLRHRHEHAGRVVHVKLAQIQTVEHDHVV